jgi:hypothetical protein
MGVHGVQRFRSIDEMAEAAVLVPPGEGFERFARQCARYFALAPRTYPRGVFRFRSIEDARSARAAIMEENLRRNRAAVK